MNASAAVARLMAAFAKELSPETVGIYVEKLADIPPPLLEAACNRLIDTQTFFPAVSEVRKCAARLAGLLPVEPAEALAIVRGADVSYPVFRRDGTPAYTEREWRWPEDIDELTLDTIRSTLEKVGEPADPDGKSHFGWEMGFQKTYESGAEAISRKALADLSAAKLPPPPDQRRLNP